MHQWWEALGHLYKMLQDADALGLSRDARRRLIITIGALDTALLNCATVDCPIRAVVFANRPPEPERSATPSPAVPEMKGETASSIESCRNCRWWGRHRGTAAEEGICLLTKTESGDGGTSQPIALHTQAKAAADDTRVGAVLLTRVSYACSQWAPA